MEDINMKKYIIILAAILTVASCAPKEEMDVTQQTSKMRFTAIHEGALATKTYLSSEEDGMYPVYWSENDKIKMFVSQHEISDGQGYQLDLESGAGSVESVFSGNVPALPESSLYYYAVYPYSLAASIGGNEAWESGQSPAEATDDSWELSNYVQIPLPSVQQYSPHSFGRDYNPAIAVSRDQTLRFKNVCGLLRINLTGDVKVGKITIESDGEEALWGTLMARYRWKRNSSESEFKLYTANGQYKSDFKDYHRSLITLDCGSGVQLSDDETDFYLVLSTSGNIHWDGGDFYDFKYKTPLHEGFTMRIYDTNGEEVFTKHTEKDNSIHRSMIRNMPVLDVRRQSFTDLSINGTANCYIVAPNGSNYSFFAGNRGCSPQPICDNNSAVLSNATVEILWETLMSGDVAPALHDVIANVSFDPTTQYISFRTTANPGNALIALKDADDNILWSWHIWSTNYDPDAIGSTDTYGTIVLMDRNLGALQESAGNESFYGLYYQWGRKDPFDAAYYPGDRKYLYYPSNPFSADPGRKTLEHITRIPTTIVDAGGDGDIYAYREEEMGDMSLGDIADLWGKKKTMYDPCPPGWKVADFDTYYQYANAFTVTEYNDYAVFGAGAMATYPKEPVWTSHHHLSYWGAICFNYDGFGTGHSSGDLKHVRCQRSDMSLELRPVIDLSASGTANCYMARPHNRYKFNASVKGNSTISVGMAAQANVEFYTENTTEIHGTRYGGLKMEDGLITDCYLKDGYIYFTTSLNNIYGNATIYLKDPQGNILWSWHIWIVDYNPDSDYDTVNWGNAGAKKFMKMNLGALNNTMYDSRSLGMMYQWGRKDPYMGAAAYDSNSQSLYELYSDYQEYGSVEASASTSTLSHALRHPGLAIMDEASGDGDWLAEHENALWGEEKTIFDPCPLGWKVPSRPIYNNHSVSSQFQYGLQMDGIWYPATGFRHPVSFNLNKVGLEGHYWYSTPKDDGNAYSFFFDSDNETVDLANHYSAKAQANAVRCMKDE